MLIDLGFAGQTGVIGGLGAGVTSVPEPVFGSILGFALLQVLLRVIVARQAPKDARTPKDERDQLIDLKSARIGFYALVAGVLLSMLLVHVHGNPWTGLESMVLAVLVAWAIKFATEIVYYRRGR